MPYDTGTAQLINQLTNPPSPFEQYGKTLQFADQFKQFQANKAISDIYGQSIDPQTGQVDLGKFNALAQQNPAALWKFGAQMQQAGVGVQAQGAGTSAQLQAAQDQLGAQAAYLQPLLDQIINKQQPVTGAQLSAALASMPPGLVPPGSVANIQRQIAQIGPNGDASGIVRGAAFANDHGQAVLKSVLPNFGTIGAGGAQVPYQANPMATTPTPSFPSKPVQAVPGAEGVTLTVGQQTIPNVPLNIANAIQQNPELLKTYYPQQYAQMNPGDKVSVSGGGGSGGAAGAPSTAPGHYPGLPPSSAPPPPGAGAGATGATGAAAPPAAPAPSAAPAPATAPAPSNVPNYAKPPLPLPPEAGGVGLTPQPGYQANVVEPSQKAATALAVAARDTPNVAGLIQDMRSQVNQPGWNPGLGAQAGSTWRQVLDKVGINATGTTPDAQKMAQASYEEFSKAANLIASRQLDTLGNPSDARQSLAEAITPGMAQSKEGVLGISATLLGNQDAINRTNAAWEQAKGTGWSDGRYNEWINKNWNATDPDTGGRFDPRVFWLADTAGTRDDQARRFVSKIPKDQQTQFVKNLNYAKKQGWVKQNDDGSYAVASP